MKYEESFQNMKYMKNTMEKPTSYYLSDPPLPDKDLQPTKDSRRRKSTRQTQSHQELQATRK